MAKKFKAAELFRLALQYAIQDRQAFIQAYAHMPDDAAAVDARELVTAMIEYKNKRWPRPTKEEQAFAGARLMTLDEIKERHKKGKQNVQVRDL